MPLRKKLTLLKKRTKSYPTKRNNFPENLILLSWFFIRRSKRQKNLRKRKSSSKAKYHSKDCSSKDSEKNSRKRKTPRKQRQKTDRDKPMPSHRWLNSSEENSETNRQKKNAFRVLSQTRKRRMPSKLPKLKNWGSSSRKPKRSLRDRDKDWRGSADWRRKIESTCWQ